MSCCDSSADGTPDDAAGAGVAGWKKEPSWEAAMKSEKVVLRARMRNWNGSIGGCVVNDSRGLMTFESKGGRWGRVRVWYSRTKRARNVK